MCFFAYNVALRGWNVALRGWNVALRMGCHVLRGQRHFAWARMSLPAEGLLIHMESDVLTGRAIIGKTGAIIGEEDGAAMIARTMA